VQFSHHRGTNKKTFCKEKNCCPFCNDVYQCIVGAEYFCASCGVWGTGNHFEPAFWQDRKPAVTVARQDFEENCIRPHAFGYGMLYLPLCLTCVD